jgi:hypothetical protein
MKEILKDNTIWLSSIKFLYEILTIEEQSKK